MMDLDLATIVAGFVVSTVGFSLLIYGKKQGHVPALVTGGLMMVLPFVGLAAWGQWAAGAALGGGLWLAVRAGL